MWTYATNLPKSVSSTLPVVMVQQTIAKAVHFAIAHGLLYLIFAQQFPQPACSLSTQEEGAGHCFLLLRLRKPAAKSFMCCCGKRETGW